MLDLRLNFLISGAEKSTGSPIWWAPIVETEAADSPLGASLSRPYAPSALGGTRKPATYDARGFKGRALSCGGFSPQDGKWRALAKSLEGAEFPPRPLLAGPGRGLLDRAAGRSGEKQCASGLHVH